MSAELVAFLRARLDADEKTVRDQLCVNCGNVVVPLSSPLGVTGYTHEGLRANEQGELEHGWEGRRCPGRLAGAEPVQNPERVLRDVEAKRRLVELHAAELGQHPDFCGYDKHELPCPTLRIMASMYADHRDYRKEWRP